MHGPGVELRPLDHNSDALPLHYQATPTAYHLESSGNRPTYTPLTPTRLNCRAKSSRRCVLNSQLVIGGFSRKIENRVEIENPIRSSWLQNWKLGHDCQRPGGHRPIHTVQHDSTRLNMFSFQFFYQISRESS